MRSLAHKISHSFRHKKNKKNILYYTMTNRRMAFVTQWLRFPYDFLSKSSTRVKRRTGDGNIEIITLQWFHLLICSVSCFLEQNSVQLCHVYSPRCIYKLFNRYDWSCYIHLYKKISIQKLYSQLFSIVVKHVKTTWRLITFLMLARVRCAKVCAFPHITRPEPMRGRPRWFGKRTIIFISLDWLENHWQTETLR